MVPATAIITANRGMDGTARSVSRGLIEIITASTTKNRITSLIVLEMVEEYKLCITGMSLVNPAISSPTLFRPVKAIDRVFNFLYRVIFKSIAALCPTQENRTDIAIPIREPRTTAPK
jgi:hypothetical protein